MIILIIRIIVSYDQNISLIIHVKDGSHGMIRHPFCVYITAHRQYTAVQKMLTPEITFLALNPWYIQSTCVHRTVTKNIKNHTVHCMYIYIYTKIDDSTPYYVRYKTQDIVLLYHIRFSSTLPTRPLVLL